MKLYRTPAPNRLPLLPFPSEPLWRAARERLLELDEREREADSDIGWGDLIEEVIEEVRQVLNSLTDLPGGGA